jgi:hypothetical protein
MSVTWTYNAPSESEPTVMVAFTDGTITHERSVNAVYTDGSYDAEATETRVAEVALGVEHKIALGVITESSGEPAPTPP